MKIPTPVEIELFMAHYDPAKAHEYYMRNRQLKGRSRSGSTGELVKVTTAGKDPRTGKTQAQIHKDARTKQRAELSQQIKNLEVKLTQLKALIRTKIAEEDALARKSMGKKERAAKEKDKPKTAAEKAKLARENEKYRAKNQQKLKTQSKSNSSSSSKSGSSSSTKSSGRSVSDLQILSTKVQGQIAVAKKKLAAL